MHTMTLKAADAVSIASLFNTLGRDQVTPVLMEIRLTLTAGKLSAYATDRFCLATYECDADGIDGEMRISTAGAKWIVTNVKPKNKHYAPEPVAIEYDTENCNFTISHNGATLSGFWLKSKFPAVETLFATWEPDTNAQPVTLNANFLTRLNKFLSEFKKVELWALELGKSPEHRPDRPGIVRAKSGRFTFLIQPNLLRQPE